jgi:hypothetical protein
MQNGLLDFVIDRSFGRPDLSQVAGAQGPGKSGRNSPPTSTRYPFFFIGPYIYRYGQRSVQFGLGL